MTRKSNVLEYSKDRANDIRDLIDNAVATGMAVTVVFASDNAAQETADPSFDFASAMRCVENEVYV